MIIRLQHLSANLSATERKEPDRLAELFKEESTPGPAALLNRCAIWDEAKYLSQKQFDYFAAASGVQMPSIYSFVLDTMSSRYRLLTEALGSQAHAGAALSMISMFEDETFKSAVASLEARRN